MEELEKRRSWLPELSEDWLAVIIGLALIVLVVVGVITDVPWPAFGLFV